MKQIKSGALKILVVGQTPPPYGGQAAMIQKMLKGRYEGTQLYHVRMNFSREMSEMRRFRFRKVIELFRVILAIIRYRWKYKPDVLYYPPSGPNLLPVLRDMAILISTRWMFKKTLFHFHASGLAEIYDRLPALLRLLFRWAYFYPDVAIRLSSLSPNDPAKIHARREFIVPYGIEDVAPSYLNPDENTKKGVPKILFVGLVSETKGVWVLVWALKILSDQGIPYRAEIVGKFESKSFEKQVRTFVETHHLDQHIKFSGVLIGEEKWQAFASSDIFCFPTYAEFESFSVVLLEAMSFGLPIVTTEWRGIPSLVDPTCAFLVPIKDEKEVAEKLKILILDQDLRKRMGFKARQRFLEHFTIAKFYLNMQKVFDSLRE